ncbi:peptidoglycan DD-metalloendopeptidase family protein [Mesobacillus maritimus]|uniref:Peptidoglycan DD-metalloendopeptidase family protein n=1 Tax=Mesobacillus maritimus TaxID=1643336 RepID=A0ABS7K2Z0_9BACI|nr:peptidoglycan DD-metalloendopeptidase family protein [Mesobacillus maritimus]MBY0096511.1 peptidoglycan DD-metalloendopeptidase family protein [Mesobacillus maritimus]
MRDYIRRLLIAGLIALCISLLFLGGKSPKAEGVSGQTEHWIWPADGEITDTFGTRNGMHMGIDIAAELYTPIYAVDSGVVSKSYYSDTYGHVVFIKHQNDYETVYAHLHKRNVNEGDSVQQGTQIGVMGNTGDSSGVHLHFEVHQDEWTYSKENVIDPDHALGLTEVGQAVVAQSRANPGGSIETSSQALTEENTEKLLSAQENRGNHEDLLVTTHIVKPGETLWFIAQKYHLTVDTLVALNKIKENNIKVGQELVVNKINQVKHYIVAKGDTLSSISRKTGISVKEIINKNKLDSNVIHPKQVLIID